VPFINAFHNLILKIRRRNKMPEEKKEECINCNSKSDLAPGECLGKAEKVFTMLFKLFRMFLRFFEKRMMKARERRIAKRMDLKR